MLRRSDKILTFKKIVSSAADTSMRVTFFAEDSFEAHFGGHIRSASTGPKEILKGHGAGIRAFVEQEA